MSSDANIPKNPFGTDAMISALKVFCQEQRLDMPKSWLVHPDDCLMYYAVSLHLIGKDRWEEFDTTVMFVLIDFSRREDRSTEAMQLKCMLEDLGEPIILTSKVADFPNKQQCFFKNASFTKIPITWSGHDLNDYEVYTKGHFEMGGFANVMERIEFIGKEIIYK